jgi:hypothetical protein
LGQASGNTVKKKPPSTIKIVGAYSLRGRS